MHRDPQYCWVVELEIAGITLDERLCSLHMVGRHTLIRLLPRIKHAYDGARDIFHLHMSLPAFDSQSGFAGI